LNVVAARDHIKATAACLPNILCPLGTSLSRDIVRKRPLKSCPCSPAALLVRMARLFMLID